MNARTWIVAGVLLAGGLLAGCNQGSTVDTGTGAPREASAPSELVAQLKSPLPDVPWPVGFSIDEKASESNASAGTRWVEHVYRGRADKWAVGRFYKRQMPTARWALVADRMIRGTIKLDFVKENERAMIEIADGNWFHPTVIRVDVYAQSGKVSAPVDR